MFGESELEVWERNIPIEIVCGTHQNPSELMTYGPWMVHIFLGTLQTWEVLQDLPVMKDTARPFSPRGVVQDLSVPECPRAHCQHWTVEELWGITTKTSRQTLQTPHCFTQIPPAFLLQIYLLAAVVLYGTLVNVFGRLSDGQGLNLKITAAHV